MNIYSKHLILLGGVLGWVCFWAFPEIVQNRIDPYDASLFAANGAMFLSAVQEFPQLLAKPIDWLYAYFNQYPALAVRRHPPLFGITEMLVYLFTGVSVYGAKLTAFLYSIAFAIGLYALSQRIWKDPLLAAATSFLVMSTPQVIWLGTAVRLDLPALTFAVWALFHYVGYIRSNQRSSAIYFAILSILGLYTYQLTFFIFASTCLHLLFLRGKSLFKDKTVLIVAVILLVFLLPLAIEQIYVAKDNFTAAVGGEVEEWKRFQLNAGYLSIEFFLYYPIEWLKIYPVQAAGLLIWIILAVRRGITQEDVLLLLCAASAFVFFTLGRGKDPRYMIYVMTPLAFLAAKGIRDLVLYRVQDHAMTKRHIAAAAMIMILGVLQTYSVIIPDHVLSGMDRPAREIVGGTMNARIFYSGPRDAGFVFYVRQHDLKRTARVFRATVQLSDPTKLAEFISKEQINFIVMEDGDRRSGEDGFAAFIDEINNFINERQTFDLYGTFPLKFINLGNEKQISLRVYKLHAPQAGTGAAID